VGLRNERLGPPTRKGGGGVDKGKKSRITWSQSMGKGNPGPFSGGTGGEKKPTKREAKGGQRFTKFTQTKKTPSKKSPRMGGSPNGRNISEHVQVRVKKMRLKKPVGARNGDNIRPPGGGGGLKKNGPRENTQ